MGLFKKRKKVVIDERTDLEVSFEEKGKKIGEETGKFVQKSINKINQLKGKYETDKKVEKVKDFAEKAEHKVEKLVEKVSQKGKDVVEKVKNK